MSDKSVWVFIRGLSREIGHWGDFPHEFSKAIYQEPICIDLPGAGEHYQLTAPLSISENTDFIRSELHRKYSEQIAGKKLKLFAISLGAMVASDWVSRFPEEISGLVLINASFANLSPFYQRMRWQILHKVIVISQIKNHILREKWVLDLVSNHRSIHDRVSKEWALIYRKHPMTQINIMRQLAAAARYHLPTERPKAPLLILSSLGDNLVSPRCSIDLQNAWGGELMRHSWGGHELVLDDAEWVLEQVFSWLKKHH